ncbi:E3 ubiquitin-protein ligase UBR5-like [Mytilus galloprovincialis]|uniref:E3 ubiquitin-protein ligase UBR5-like n=1 Tax=Mytilus galloprovincialis TaxID=29158 RepID=UPI003F7B4EEC
MTSIHCIVHPLPGTDDQLNDRLREVAEKVSHHGFVSSPAFRAIRNLTVTQCVVGPTYIALLLEAKELAVQRRRKTTTTIIEIVSHILLRHLLSMKSRCVYA